VEEPGRIKSRSRERARDRRGRKRRRVLRWAGGLLLLGVVFFCGLAVGRALEEDNRPAGQTLVRTLLPTTLTPPRTVTVTVSNP
jgi:hypothetical protein